MKSLLRSLLLLPLIAVIAVNGLYFPENGNGQLELKLRNSVNTTTAEPSGDCESNGGECKKNKKQCKATISTEFTCSSKGVCCIEEAKAQGASELMLEMLSNTILIQGMAMETLKEDQENSMSNLTNIIVNLKQTVEIKNSNLSDAISNQGMALQSNFSDGFSDQENMLDSLENNQDSLSESLNQLINDVDSKIFNLTNLIKKQGCPIGFFTLAHHCFKLYTDTRRSWTAAKSKCESEGLRMAEIDKPTPLMDILVTTIGVNHFTWVGAKGDGSYVRWQSDNSIMPSGTSNYVAHYAASTSQCMMILSTSNHMSSYRVKAFHSYSCTSGCYTLCELV